MRGLVVIVFALVIATPAWADVCSEYREAVALSDAVDALFDQRMSDTDSSWPEYRAMLDLKSDAASRLDAAERAVLANMKNETAAAAIRELYALRLTVTEIWDKVTAWDEDSEMDDSLGIISPLVQIQFSITRAIKAAISWACR